MDLRAALTALTSRIQDPATPLPERIDAAAQVWRLIEEARASLEPFKEELRANALALLKGKPGTATLPGAGLSSARVTLPALGFELNGEGPSFEAARAALGEDFDRVYRVRLTLVPRSAEELNQLPPAARAHLAGRVRLVTAKARVSLALLDGVTPVNPSSQD